MGYNNRLLSSDFQAISASNQQLTTTTMATTTLAQRLATLKRATGCSVDVTEPCELADIAPLVAVDMQKRSATKFEKPTHPDDVLCDCCGEDMLWSVREARWVCSGQEDDEGEEYLDVDGVRWIVSAGVLVRVPAVGEKRKREADDSAPAPKRLRRPMGLGKHNTPKPSFRCRNYAICEMSVDREGDWCEDCAPPGLFKCTLCYRMTAKRADGECEECVRDLEHEDFAAASDTDAHYECDICKFWRRQHEGVIARENCRCVDCQFWRTYHSDTACKNKSCPF